MSDETLLEPVGLGHAESTLYLRLLSDSLGTVTDIAESLGRSSTQVQRSIELLLEAGLVTRLPGTPVRYVPAAPDVAVDALVLQRQHELERLRARTRELADVFHQIATSGPGDLVELVEGKQALRQRIAQMQLGAQHEVLVVDCPPYLGGGTPEDNPVQYQNMARGVVYRSLYHGPALEGRMDEIQQYIAAGERARSLPSVREKMMVVDQRCALMPLSFSFDSAEMYSSVYIRHSPLLAALVTCFEMLWERATPLGTAGNADTAALDEHDRELLEMLTSGMKDVAIMRALGITQRTMTRRIARLLHNLDASTRFQAGVQAARRGLL